MLFQRTNELGRWKWCVEMRDAPYSLKSHDEKPQTSRETAVCATGLRMAKEAPETNPLLQRLSDLNQRAEAGGGAERQARQRSAGKLTARERIEFLLDNDSFEEIDKFVTHRCLDFGMQDQQFPVTASSAGYGRIDGPAGLCLRPGLHRFRRLLSARPTRRKSARSWIWP